MKTDVLRICKVRWTGLGKFHTENRMFYFSGGDQHLSGVGILVKKDVWCNHGNMASLRMNHYYQNATESFSFTRQQQNHLQN